MRHGTPMQADTTVRLEPTEPQLPPHWRAATPTLPDASVFVSEAGITVLVSVETMGGRRLRVVRMTSTGRALTGEDIADVRATFFTVGARVKSTWEDEVPNVLRLTTELPN